MADKDLAEKVLVELPDVFADIHNSLVFKGKAILKPENLRQIPTETVSNPGGKGWKQLFRDVVMENVVTGERYMILAIENQSRPDAIMPLRGMGMDYAEYEKQIRLLNADKKKRHGTRKRKQRKAWQKRKLHLLQQGKLLIPVITLILYYGEQNWFGPRSLYEMMKMPDEDMYPGVKKYIHDYGMNLVVLKDLKQEEEELFTSDFRYLVKYLRNYNDPDKQKELLLQEDSILEHRKETMMAMAALTRDERFAALAEKEKEGKGMCKMLDYIEERGAKLHVIGQVSKKLQRGLSLSQIAEQVEEDEDTVASICKVIWECEPGSTSEVIYERLFQKNS